MKQLLLNREFIVEGNWYAPLKKLLNYKSVVKAEFIDTTSSAGDWTGYFVQVIDKTAYVILFEQENNFSESGFTLRTVENVVAQFSYDKEFVKNINEVLEDIYAMYY